VSEQNLTLSVALRFQVWSTAVRRFRQFKLRITEVSSDRRSLNYLRLALLEATAFLQDAALPSLVGGTVPLDLMLGFLNFPDSFIIFGALAALAGVTASAVGLLDPGPCRAVS